MNAKIIIFLSFAKKNCDLSFPILSGRVIRLQLYYHYIFIFYFYHVTVNCTFFFLMIILVYTRVYVNFVCGYTLLLDRRIIVYYT